MDRAVNLSEAYAVIESEIPKLPGWCTVEKARRLARLCADRRLRVGVELGVFGGRSLLAMALGCSVNGFGRVDGVDPYDRAASLEGTNSSQNDQWWGALDHEAIMREAAQALELRGLGVYARLVRARSLDVVSRYDEGSIDVLHQDSNHSAEVSSAEVLAFASKMALGGFWVMDDVDWPTTKRAQDLLVEIGFKRVEEYGNWAVYQSVGGEIKRGT